MHIVVHDPEDMEALAVVDVPRSYLFEVEMHYRPPFHRVNFNNSSIDSAQIRFQPVRFKGTTHWLALAENPRLLHILRLARSSGDFPSLRAHNYQSVIPIQEARLTTELIHVEMPEIQSAQPA